MKATTFNGTIVRGQFQPSGEAYYRHHLSKYEGKQVQMALIPKKRVRSDRQHRTYWWWLDILSEHTGHTTDELHRLFKGLYLPKKFITYRGKEFHMSSSTTELTTSEFMEYMEHIAREAAELGCVLPEPNELHNI